MTKHDNVSQGKIMKATEFVKKHGWEKSKSTLTNAHHKATHFYCGWMGLVDYFYKHESLGWCQLDIRTKGWDSDRCTQGIHPPVNAMVSVDDLKRLVESYELVGIHGYESSKEIVANAPSDDHFYSWALGDSGVRDKTVNIGELRKAIADVETCQ